MDISISFCCPILYHRLYPLQATDLSVQSPLAKDGPAKHGAEDGEITAKGQMLVQLLYGCTGLFVLSCLGYLRDNLASSESNVLVVVGLRRLHGGCESLVWVALKDTAHSSDLSVERNRLANSASSSAGDGGSRHIEKCLKLKMKILYGVINLIGVLGRIRSSNLSDNTLKESY